MKPLRLLALTFGVAVAIAQPGCLGGQTGQPTTASCVQRAVAGGSIWRDSITVDAAAQAFVGDHHGDLRWGGTPELAENPLLLDDSVVITVTRRDAPVRSGCSNELHVPVTLELVTRKSNISERIETELEISPSDEPLRAAFLFATATLQGDGELAAIGSGGSPSGTLLPRPMGGAEPGEFAFIVEVTETGAAGAGGVGGAGG